MFLTEQYINEKVAQLYALQSKKLNKPHVIEIVLKMYAPNYYYTDVKNLPIVFVS